MKNENLHEEKKVDINQDFYDSKYIDSEYNNGMIRDQLFLEKLDSLDSKIKILMVLIFTTLVFLVLK